MGSMVAETISGTSSRRAALCARRTPSAAALRFRVSCAGQQRGRLDLVGGRDLVERHVARDRDRARGGAHGPDDEPVAGSLAGEDGRRAAELVGALGEAVLREDIGGTAEGVRGDHVGAGVEVGGVDAADHVGPREVQMLVAALVALAAEVVGAEAGGLDHRPHRAVEHQDAPGEDVGEARHIEYSSAHEH